MFLSSPLALLIVTTHTCSLLAPETNQIHQSHKVILLLNNDIILNLYMLFSFAQKAQKPSVAFIVIVGWDGVSNVLPQGSTTKLQVKK